MHDLPAARNTAPPNIDSPGVQSTYFFLPVFVKYNVTCDPRSESDFTCDLMNIASPRCGLHLSWGVGYQESVIQLHARTHTHTHTHTQRPRRTSGEQEEKKKKERKKVLPVKILFEEVGFKVSFERCDGKRKEDNSRFVQQRNKRHHRHTVFVFKVSSSSFFFIENVFT